MNELIEKYPYLFPLFFICMWIFVSKLIALLGGWKLLADCYPSRKPFQGKKWYFQIMRLGWAASYNSCVTLGANENSVFLSVLPIFRVGHPPMEIPLTEIRGNEYKGFLFTYVDIYTKKAKNTRIRLFRKQADRIEQAAGHTWKYQRRS